MRTMKRRFAVLLALALIIQLLPVVPFALTTADLVDSSFNGEGLWITEIYNNDVDRSTKGDTRATDGYQTIPTYASASDLMEFIEVCNTHDEAIELNDRYQVYLDDTLMPVTDMSDSADIILTRGQVAVLWNYRTDIVMPTEAEFRKALDIPDTAVVLKLYYGANWVAEGGTFTIKDKLSGETVSTFNVVRDTHTKDGLGVHLKMPVFKGSAMEVYRAMDLPTAGRVLTAQVNGLIQAQTPAGFDGKGLYITELRPNDVDRSGTYGTTSDVMECLEVTNTSDSDITLNTDIQLVYTVKEGFRKPLTVYKYSSSAADRVGSSSGCVVPAGDTVVLWCYRYSHLTDYTSFPTPAKVREAYGISSDTKVYIFTGQNGMTNDLRGFELFTRDANGDLDRCQSRYFWLGDADCPNGTSAHLKISPEGPTMQLYAGSTASSLGTVEADQLSFVVDDGSAMELRLYDGCSVPHSIMQGQDLRVYFYYKAHGLERTNSATYYRMDGTGEWKLLTEGGIRVPNRYEVVISGAELFDHDYVEFYVEKSNAYRTTRKGIYRVEIDKLNDVDGVRTNITEGEVVKGTVAITANDGGSNSATKIYIDGKAYTTTPMLEDGGYFSYTVEGIDSYFRNAITTNKDKLITHIGKWAFESLTEQIKHIDSSYFTYSSGNYKVVLRFWAGTYTTVAQESLEPKNNRDDYSVTHLKMKLPNGKEYLPSKIGPSSYGGVDTSANTNTSTAYNAVHKVGDASKWCPYMNVTFTIPESDVDAVGVELDTTTLSDGRHTLKVVSGTSTKEVSFIVDNASPKVDLGIAGGASLTGNITFAPQVTDANALSESVVTLDGVAVQTPYATTAYALGEGEHTLAVYVKDAAGNETTKEVTFLVDDIAMSVTDAGSKDITHSSAQLYLTAQSDAATDVTFYRAEKIDAAKVQTSTKEGIVPYLQYTIDVSGTDAGDEIRVDWDGDASGADDAHATRMFVRNAATGAWELIGEADATGVILDATFPVEGHVTDGKAVVIVQCTPETALPDLDTVNDGVTGNNAGWDGSSAPADHDFSFAWISDTQIYVQRYQPQFMKMNQWIVDNAEKWKIKYVMHTGDIVDDWDTMYQWENADQAMKIFDEAGMPYGVLGGNHDVASGLDDHETYLKYFGEHRVKDQPTFGGSYKNNLGHYDLVSENGQDFIIVYMSWIIDQEEIDWMNEVLAKYSDRKAILCFHAYTHVRESVDGLLDQFGVLVRDNVVAKNPNVFAVLNGHYSGATYQTVRFDDNGDGKLDRTVYQICTDYQSVEKGGLQYIKFLYFDLDNDKVFINSYSPSMDDFNYYDGTAHDLKALAKAASNGVVSGTDIDSLILSVNFSVTEQTIREDAFSAEIYTDEVLGTATLDGATGNASVDVTGLEAQTGYHWYAVLENGNTGYLKTETYAFTTTEAPVHEYVATVTAPGCTQKGYTTYTCSICGDSYIDDYVDAAGHSWVDASCNDGKYCSVCGDTDGEALGHDYAVKVEPPTCVEEGSILYTCNNCGDTYTETITANGHSYKNGTCSVCGAADPDAVKKPTLTLKYPSLSFEGEVLYNIYYTGADMDSVVEMGMLTFNERLTDGTIAEAVDVIPGYSGSDGVYMVQSLGIPAKALGDTVFMKVYAKLSDGSYVYSDVAGYNAVAYAKSVLNSNSSDEMKALVVSMLNYGTEAQLYFKHNTDNLMNSFLSAEQQAMIPAYDESLVDPIVAADSTKAANFPRTTSVFSTLYASVSFDGAFSINYYVMPNVKVDDGITFYYWDAETYATAEKLTAENAVGNMTMTYTDAETPYWGCVPNIAAKYMDTTYYAAGVFESDGTTYTTGVISYSLGRYCESVAAKDGNEQQAFAKATAVYGWCAEEYFASI